MVQFEISPAGRARTRTPTWHHIVTLVSDLHERLSAGIDVLDVGCGRGRAMIALAQAYPNSRAAATTFPPKRSRTPMRPRRRRS